VSGVSPSPSFTSNPKTNIVSDKQNIDQMELVFLLTLLMYYSRLNKAVISHMTSLISETQSEAKGEPRDLVLLPLSLREM
jgi:hypothetical protein